MGKKTGFAIVLLAVLLISAMSTVAQEQIEYEDVDITCIGTGGNESFVISTQEEYQELIDNSSDLHPNPALYCIDYEFPEIDFETKVLLIQQIVGGGCEVEINKSVTLTPQEEYPTSQVFTYKIIWKEIGTCEIAQSKNVAVTISKQEFLDKMVDYPYKETVKFLVEKQKGLPVEEPSPFGPATNTAAGARISIVPGVLSTPMTVSGVSIASSTAGGANRLVLTQGDFSVQTASNLEVADEALYVKTASGSTAAVTVLPAQALSLITASASIDPVTATSTVLEVKNNTPFYTASGKKKGNLLFVIPVEYDVTVEVNAQTGVTAVNKPWWTLFVAG